VAGPLTTRDAGEPGGGASNLRFEILGPVRAFRGGRELDLGPPRQLAVLAVLLLNHGHAVGRAELEHAIWGQDAPPSARNLVATYVARLRKVLEPARPSRAPATLLSSTVAGYRITPAGGGLDAQDFADSVARARTLRRDGDPAAAARLLELAVAAWRGPRALEGASGPYIEAERRRLMEARTAAYEELFDAALELGRHAECVAELTALSIGNPLREHVRSLLMLALYRTGRQAEALAVFQDYRRVLADQTGLDPGERIRRLNERILAADPQLLITPHNTQDGTTTAAAATPAAAAMPPAQLPADAPDFTGRAEQLERIRQTLGVARPDGDCGMRIVVLAGPGGMGKTTLALRAAHRLRDDYPDGQLYLDLQGVRDRPREPEELLRRLLRDLGAGPADPPADLSACAAQYRTLTSGRRLLIVLDDVRDAAQVRPLLPGSATCGVLITSRTRLADLPGAELLDLAPLSGAEGRDLLGRIVGPGAVGAENAAADRIVTACAGLPLALRIVAARAASRPPGTLGRLADRLGDERRRLSELTVGDLAVSASFQLGYDNMLTGAGDADLARVFRILSTLRVPYFGVDEAAAAAGHPPERTEALLDELGRLHLLEQHAADRYHFHELLRLFGRERSRETDPEGAAPAAIARVFAYHARMIGHADALLRPRREAGPATAADPQPFADTRAAIAWLEEHHGAIIGAAHQAAEDAAVSPSALAEFLTALRGYLQRRGHWLDWERLADASLRAAAAVADQRAMAISELELGTVLSCQHRSEEAVTRLKRSAQLYAAAGDRTGQSRALNNMSVVLTDLGRYDDAAPRLLEALAIQESADDERGACISLNNLARLHLMRKEYPEALYHSEQAIVRTRAARMPVLTGVAFNILGLIHCAEQRYAEAVDAQTESLRLSREQGDREREAFALVDLSDAGRHAGRYREAVTWAEQALVVRRQLSDTHGEARALERLGDALHEAGEVERARVQWQQALDLLGGLDPELSAALRTRLTAA
jgi:DNA-binding SARP family transcriptional activator/predicted negative regulator of RcsB-dependent stress response